MISISNNIVSEDIKLFLKAHRETISDKYPKSSDVTAMAFIDAHNQSKDPNGYFTVNKTVWKIIQNDIVCGFTVVAQKRGGSIKFGPTMILTEHQGKGLGGSIRKLVEEEYAKQGYRKAYSTTNLNNRPAIFYILKIGYKIELHLQNHYEIGKDELVLSKQLEPIIDFKEGIEIDISSLYDYEKQIYNELKKYCAEINKDFFLNVRKALVSKNSFTEEDFALKKKVLFTSNSKECVSITTPKRGGCVKISPICFSRNEQENDEVLTSIKEHYKDYFHKIYAHIPLEDTKIDYLKSRGFYLEGIISSPYKSNVDLLMMSKIIK